MSQDALSTRQFGEYTLHYGTEETGGRRPQHVIKITHPEHIGTVGSMTWTGQGIRNIGVDPNHRRSGLGTAMWEFGQEQKVKPKHSADRTEAGTAWAKKMGGRLPRLKKGN